LPGPSLSAKGGTLRTAYTVLNRRTVLSVLRLRQRERRDRMPLATPARVLKKTATYQCQLPGGIGAKRQAIESSNTLNRTLPTPIPSIPE